MAQLYLIIRREYLSRIKKKSFVVLTLLMPLLFISIFFTPKILSHINDSETKVILVLDPSGIYSPHLGSSYNHYHFVFQTNGTVDLNTKLQGNLFGVLQISGDLLNNKNTITFFSDKQPPPDLLLYFDQVLSNTRKSQIINQLINNINVDRAIVGDIQRLLEDPLDINITTNKWNNDEVNQMSTNTSSVIGGILTFIMYMFILMYGTMVMQGVVEEKSNRIVEIMLSSVKPFYFMMGKILGVGLVGLTQLIVWIIILSVIWFAQNLFFNVSDFMSYDIKDTMQSIDVLSSDNYLEIGIYFFLLFIGGYLIYASLFAMFGASVDNAQDTQQFVMPITLLFIFAFYAGIYSLENPNGSFAFWCSIIPFTSPIVMIVRIPFEIPLWEKLLSVSILYITSILSILVSAKVYRIRILMYGKKTSCKEIFKSFYTE